MSESGGKEVSDWSSRVVVTAHAMPPDIDCSAILPDRELCYQSLNTIAHIASQIAPAAYPASTSIG